MAEKNLRLTVLMPSQVVLDTEADFVLLRTSEGDMGILHGHEPSAIQLDYGVLRAFTSKKPTDILALLGGFAIVKDNHVTVMTSLAGPPDKIGDIITENEKQRSENQLLEQRSALEMQRVEAALRHTLVHMDISSYSIIKGNEEKTE